MKIVVLDGFTMNPGDLDIEPLTSLGECEIHDRTSEEDVLQRIGNAEIVLTNKTVLDAAIINTAPRLKYIGVLATGYNVVDLEAARAKNIVVTNVPAYSTASVVQMVFALLLELTQKVALHDKLVRKGRWEECPDFSFTAMPLMELEGKTMGIVGYGTIGQRVAQVARSFGMEILVHTAHPEKYEGDVPVVRFTDLDNLFGQSDVISLHCPLTPETENLVNEERVGLMKKSAILINTGRGQLVDEWALSDALDAKEIAGAGIDVLSEEPPRTHHPLIGARNCFVTPHIAWATREARRRLLAIAAENVKAFIDGEPVNVVN